MKTGNAIILMTGIVLLVFVGLVAAEDFMMPQELEEKQTVIANNSSDNAPQSVNVKRHVPPRGFMQNIVVVFWDPFGNAPVDNLGFKNYNNALWYQYHDHTWIQVANINNVNQITNIQVWDQNILNDIKNNYQTADNVTISILEEPPAYEIKQSETSDNTNTNNTTPTDTEKINTTIDLDDKTLKNDTNTTITGTLLDENGTAIADAEVTITVNGQSYTETTDSNGKFSYEYNTESTDLDIGTNSMQVSYSGNETYNGISKTITITLEAVEEDLTDTVEPTETETYDDSSSSYSNEKIDNSEYSYSSDDEYYPVEDY